MTPEQIKQIAIEEGAIFDYRQFNFSRECFIHGFETMEQFVAFAERIAELQRENDAKICDNQADRASTSPGNARADSCARAIRNNTGE